MGSELIDELEPDAVPLEPVLGLQLGQPAKLGDTILLAHREHTPKVPQATQ